MIKLKINFDRGRDALVRLDGVAQGLQGGKSERAIRNAAKRYAHIAVEELRRTAPRKKGTLAASFYVVTTANGANVRSRVPYARIQDRGGVIRPVKAKVLAIPLTPEAKLRKPREWPELFVFRSRSGKGFLAVNRGGRLMVQYVFKASVYIRPQRYMAPALLAARRKIALELRQRGLLDR